MTSEYCDRVMLELSVAHDEGRAVDGNIAEHVQGCDVCTGFATGLDDLTARLAPGDYSQTPDLTSAMMDRLERPSRQWWSVAAVALVGLVAGAIVGLSARWDVGTASDLGSLFHDAAPEVERLSADLLVVERGLYPDVPERVYTGSLDYAAPEKLALRLVDTTEYPDARWVPNDVDLVISDGDVATVAGSPCPVAAMPECLVDRSARHVADLPPFDDGILVPLELIGPGRSLTWPSAIDVLGTTEVEGAAAIQVRSTVAAVDMIGAITGQGSWRDLHPTDEVLMWLDEETLVPLRIEVFAVDTPQRELWQLRHGYEDDLEGETPIFIVELSGMTDQAEVEGVDLPTDAPSRGFVDTDVEFGTVELPEGFTLHRSGHRHLADGGRVDVASWSDGRSWVKVEITSSWEEPRLFGLVSPFVEEVALGPESVGYLSPEGSVLAVHSDGSDAVISGSVASEVLIEVASSLQTRGVAVPATWAEAATIRSEDLPPGALVPSAEGWSLLGRIDGDTTTLLLTGGGSQSVLIQQTSGTRLDPPIGPDYSETEVRGISGRYNASETTLEWVENETIVRMRSDTVALAELVELADTMQRR